MTWSLDFCRDPARVARLTELNRESPRFDGSSLDLGIGSVRQVLAGARFEGGPGRDRQAAQAWAFEMKEYFKRGTGEPPVVTYADGIYTVVGLIQTTHPGDHPKEDGIAWFS